MSKLSIDQKNIMNLFQDKKSDFLIPDYQRPYAWTETECLTLWDDLFEFAIPGNNADKFNKDDEYYLGPIVTFKNDDGKLEIIEYFCISSLLNLDGSICSTEGLHKPFCFAIAFTRFLLSF